MSNGPSDRPAGADTGAWFAATHWSVVLAAKEGAGREAEAALEALCRAYWEPLYAWLRRSGHPVHDAQDLTQAFFAHLLSRPWLAGVSPDKGKFRSFLLVSLKNFLGHERAKAAADKRGGGCQVVPLEPELAEEHLAQELTGSRTAEGLFERRWALATLKNAHARLQSEYAAAGKAGQLARLGLFLTCEGGGNEYAAAGAELGLTAGAVTVAVHRLRRRWREAIRTEIAQTVSSAAEVEEEMRYLLEVILHSGGGGPEPENQNVRRTPKP